MTSGSSSKPEQQLEALLDKLRRSQVEQERVSTRLAKAMDDLGSNAISGLDKALRSAAKNSGLLTDEHLELIKTTKDLNDAIEHQERLTEKAIEAQKKLHKAAEWELEIAQDQYELDIKALGLTHEQVKNLIDNNAQFKKLAGKQIDAAESLDHFTKHVIGADSALGGWIKKTFTMSAAMDKLSESIKQQVDELNKATAVGLQSSLMQINLGAGKLRMTFDEFSDIISKNRDVIRQMGGGAEATHKFANELKDASQGLAFMGKDGTIATTRFIDSLKSTGISMTDPQFSKAMGHMQKDFIKTSGVFGDTAEQYADIIESQLKGASVQNLLIAASKEQRLKIQDEIRARVTNMKTLGLSNEQIKEFNASLENIYDPSKNQEVQKIQEGEMTKSMFQQIAEMQPENNDFAKAMPTLLKLATMQENGATAADFQKAVDESGSSMLALGKAMAEMEKKQQKLYDEGKYSEALMLKNTMNHFREEGGGLAKVLTEGSTKIAEADASGKSISVENRKKQETAVEKSVADPDLYIKSLSVARDAMQQVSSLMSNSLIKAIEGTVLGFGALLLSSGKFGKALEGLSLYMQQQKAGSNIPGAANSPKGGAKPSKFGGFIKGGGLALIGEVGEYAGDKMQENGYEKSGAAVSTLGQGAKWAGYGAMLGSVIPGPGTAIGATVGGAAGLAYGAYENWDKMFPTSTPITPLSPSPVTTAANEPTEEESKMEEEAQSIREKTLSEQQKQTGLLTELVDKVGGTTTDNRVAPSDMQANKSAQTNVARNLAHG